MSLLLDAQPLRVLPLGQSSALEMTRRGSRQDNSTLTFAKASLSGAASEALTPPAGIDINASRRRTGHRNLETTERCTNCAGLHAGSRLVQMARPTGDLLWHDATAFDQSTRQAVIHTGFIQ
jgi:hypothetical protein